MTTSSKETPEDLIKGMEHLCMILPVASVTKEVSMHILCYNLLEINMLTPWPADATLVYQ